MRKINHSVLLYACVVLLFLFSALQGSADTLSVVENQVTFTGHYETTPTLSNYGAHDLMVYTSREMVNTGFFDQGDIYYQALWEGKPVGTPVQVTANFTDDTLNDVSGNHIVFTAYDDTKLPSGNIMLYTISSGQLRSIRNANIIQEPKIHDNYVVWCEGETNAAVVMIFDLSNPTGMAEPLTESFPPTYSVEIGNRFVVWAEYDGIDFDIVAFDLHTGFRHNLTNSKFTDERQPVTSGNWIVWQAIDIASPMSRIEAYDATTSTMHVIVDNGAYNRLPSIDGDLISYEADPKGDFDVFVYRISTRETFNVTIAPGNQYLNNVNGNLVSYVDLRSGNEDVYVATLNFLAPDPCASSEDDSDDDSVCDADDN